MTQQESRGPALRKLARPNKRKPITTDTSSTAINHIHTENENKVTRPNPTFSPNNNVENIRALVYFILHVAFVGIGLFLVIQDVLTFRFSTSNGRFISFMDSFDNCFSFRFQQPFQPIEVHKTRKRSSSRRKSYYHIGNPVRPIKWKLRSLLVSFLLKYGPSTVVSALLWTKPVFIKGARHIVYFTLALILIQFFPSDIPYKTVKNSYWVQLMIALSVSFYKFRKLLYVVHVFDGRHTITAWIQMMGLAIIAIDGNSLARVIENILTHRGLRTSCLMSMYDEFKLGLGFFWERSLGLLLCSTTLFVTNSVCRMSSESTLGPLACHLYLLTQFGALFIFMERKNIWRAKKGQSLLWKIMYNGVEKDKVA